MLMGMPGMLAKGGIEQLRGHPAVVLTGKVLVAGLRLLEHAMCPRFHCDNLPVRLVTTSHGHGCEWLPEWAVNHQRLLLTLAPA